MDNHFSLPGLIAGNLRTGLHAPLAQVVIAFVAMFCGAIIGSEREKREKPAGLRTLILVCIGSAAFTMAGFAFTSSTGDSGRVAAQIVTGIGFLGAGVILHPRGMISGATTAAGIWVTASVGMIAGAGYAGAALGLSLLVRFVLAAVSAYERRLFGRLEPVTVSLDFEPSEGLTRVHLERILVDYPISAITAEWQGVKDGLARLTLRIRLPRHHLREFLDDLVSVPEVKKVREVESESAAKD
jgi:putative Mg2+ transporter-C (MgtC) family protein